MGTHTVVFFILKDLFDVSLIHRSDYSPSSVISNSDRLLAGNLVNSQLLRKKGERRRKN